MKKLLIKFLKYLTEGTEEEKEDATQPQPAIEQESTTPTVEAKQEIILPKSEPEAEEKPVTVESENQSQKKIKEPKKVRRKKPIDGEIVEVKIDPRDIRDVMELMEVPFVSLSKNRTEPINYENSDGTVKVKISCHSNHYLASIYDWDIILFVASKIQEIINSKSDIPPRTIVVPRHELLKAIFKHDGKTNRKQMEESLARLQLTGIETTIRNEDYRYRGGFGFLDSWGYTERKDIKEFHITLSQWLYDGICRQGSLLKVRPEYFKVTSGIKKFLYRTARKHVGNQNQSWDFLVETLYEKSGSEREFKKFKYDLKKAVSDNDIPAYSMDWIEKDGKSYVRFLNMKKEIGKMLSNDKNNEETQQK
jgi:plasmid replication initiation protein